MHLQRRAEFGHENAGDKWRVSETWPYRFTALGSIASGDSPQSVLRCEDDGEPSPLSGS
jgi:hypothetical protein